MKLTQIILNVVNGEFFNNSLDNEDTEAVMGAILEAYREGRKEEYLLQQAEKEDRAKESYENGYDEGYALGYDEGRADVEAEDNEDVE